MKTLKIAIVQDGIVKRIQDVATVRLQDANEEAGITAEQAVVIQPGDVVHQYDQCPEVRVSFTENPEASDLVAAQLKKSEFAASIQSAKTMDELKAIVTAMDEEINP